MYEYKESLRPMTDYENSLIEEAIFSINMHPNRAFTVYCDTSNHECTPFIATLIRSVKDHCRGITGCVISSDKIVFGKDHKNRGYSK